MTDLPKDTPYALATHYGPTPTDPDPGKLWHYGCGGEVWWLEGGEICNGCGAQADPCGCTGEQHCGEHVDPDCTCPTCLE